MSTYVLLHQREEGRAVGVDENLREWRGNIAAVSYDVPGYNVSS